MKITSARDLAAVVRGRRMDLHLSQTELASRTGVSRPWLSRIEAGKPTAEFGLIIRLCETLGLSLHLAIDDRGSDDSRIDLDAVLEGYEAR